MSVQAMTWAKSQQLVEDHTARHVLLVLADSADRNGCNAFPSVDVLAQETGLTERTVRDKLDDLEKLGAIRQGDRALLGLLLMKGEPRPICYDLTMDLPPLPPVPAPKPEQTRGEPGPV